MVNVKDSQRVKSGWKAVAVFDSLTIDSMACFPLRSYICVMSTIAAITSAMARIKAAIFQAL
jgi:hypothetical protein